MKKQVSNRFQKIVTKCNNLISSVGQKSHNLFLQLHHCCNSSPYARLMRLHEPVGILLVLLPVLWALVAASSNVFQFMLWLPIFIIGAVATRSAGCILNDIVDREIDKYVERTKKRPLTNGELSVIQAKKFVIIPVGVSLIILLFLPIKAIFFGILAGVLTALYPFAKRYSNFPQIFLGLIFNLGVFIAWFTIQDYLSFVPILIYIAAVLWTIGYDTIYAHQDKQYDRKIGVKSMAITLQNQTKEVVRYLYRMAILLLGLAGLNLNLNAVFFLLIFLVSLKLNEQIDDVELDSPTDCKNKFYSNVDYQLIILLAFTLGEI
ncbi:4-hydroxybenzoate octaprenyltransferase [Candidatus Bandiella euplotis]|uniref:4-hydroxybenzoate octaprenyltransferase n=1 Tax=Candidatus Bandiella euplotis TaxID=1664265 RepID=A0ABZ0ULK8_9RICK|nr:4-hydroxybenzoate octaprenyltransferase [Candidatus Bandiella woodruffii]WPX96136.1 4-hydroxybenzoate octaprenyltransferase [Candidatus Bandiella woodruffii]